MEDLTQYLIKSPKQILAHLNTLISKKCLISATFGNNQSFLTAILDIDTKKNLLTIDCGPKEYLNKVLLSSGFVNFKSDVEGISVLFTGHKIQKSGNMSEPALSMKIPETIYWVQRRRTYRVRSPLSKQSYCSITFQNDDNDEEEILDFQLFDLSATGFSILSETKDLAKHLSPTSIFNDCQLVLNNTETHIISFSVQSVIPFNATNPLKRQRIGCQFLNINPATETAFIRYMQMIEREIKNNLG